MSIRKAILCTMLIPIVALAGGGIILRPGNGYTVTHGRQLTLGWSNPYTPVARYWFDPTATNELGKVNDSSGNANHGTLIGTTWTLEGTNTVANSALNGRLEHCQFFDGLDDGILISDSASLDVSTSVTFYAWIKMSNLHPVGDAGYTVFRKSNAYIFRNYSVNPPGTDAFDVYMYGLTPNRLYHTLNPFSANVWYFWAATYDGSTITLYTNGVAATNISASGNLTATTNDLSIGYTVGNTQYFPGKLDDVSIFHRAFTAGEIMSIYTNTTKPNGSNETGY